MSQPSPTMQKVLDRLAAEDAGLGDPSLLDPEQGRALSAITNIRWNANPPPVKSARNLMHAGLPARLIEPLEDDGSDAILHIHGGGWAFCSTATHEGAARRLANACHAPVLSVEYRLAPEHPWPDGLDDVVEAFLALDHDGRRWSIGGDSAGANLSLCATLRLMRLGARLPAQVLLFYGVFGADFASPSYIEFADGPGLTRAKMRRFWDWYADEAERGNPEVVPLSASDDTLSTLPPLYLNAAGLDPLRSDAERFVDRLRTLGRDDPFDLVPGVVHGFMQMGNALPEAEAAFARTGGVFRKRAG